MANDTTAHIVAWIQYLGAGDAEYSRHDFCGSCGLHLDTPYGSPRHIDEVMDNGDIHHFSSCDGSCDHFRRDRFCRHCGAELDWETKGEPINIRAVNHLDGGHGFHRGDSHLFEEHPAGHYLGSSGGPICWCDPVVTALPEGCEIRHRVVAADDPRRPQIIGL